MNGFDNIYQEYKRAGEEKALNEVDQEVQSNVEQIIAVRKNDDGDIIAFKTEGGRELDYVTALSEAKAGKLANIDVFHKYGRDIIRSEPDGIKENNLVNLDTF
ncbi:DUF3892 domain-containing protein [Aquibacillus rhizosphaerae]|uniref:DUF3892 domain-containing protein n=1 Tax=Aquibacillus rhizosphaerae TaxID=3051431 RepID=A0ABT7L2X7_9BACI|nr:DUF3892 domain-containing protein [Aquibacillus sp. LR5S19]MDL4839749.1 DUF3892 domain-containing protein [Aquibacillus sp. LR5S19]